MTKQFRIAAFAVIAAALSFAPLANAAWKIVDPAVPVTSKGGFAVTLPADWNFDTSGTAVIASHDGPMLNVIAVRVMPAKEAFKSLKQPYSPDALPEDLAEAYIAAFQAAQKVNEFQLLSTEPADMAGRPGFRVRFQYRIRPEAGGALIEQVTVGTGLPSGLLVATYFAPQIHFFPLWLPAFDATVGKVALTEAK
jgi:hypothetical protein